MKHKFKDKCDVCGEWKNCYTMLQGITICDYCAAKKSDSNKVIFMPLDESLGEAKLYEG